MVDLLWCPKMQGLASFNGVNSSFHRISTDNATSFELAGLNLTTPVTGVFGLDTLIARLVSFESILYLSPASVLLGVSGAALLQIPAYMSALLETQLSSELLRLNLLTGVSDFAAMLTCAAAQPGVSQESIVTSLKGLG